MRATNIFLFLTPICTAVAGQVGCAADVLIDSGPEMNTMKGDDPRTVELTPADPRFDLTLGLRVDRPKVASDQSLGPPQAADARPLSDDAVRGLLSRLPKQSSRESAEFRLPPEGPPPPRADRAAQQPFPPPRGDQPVGPRPDEADETGPLELVWKAPEGSVPIARGVLLQFNQPMVALAAPSEVAANRSPATVTPQPPGAWRWVDPFTLVFEPEGGRLPAATKYSVRLKEDVTAQGGARLPKAVEWGFETSRPEVVQSYPARKATGVSTRPLVILVFNQRVDADTVASSAELEVDGRPGPSLERVSASALSEDPKAEATYREAPKGWAVVLRPAEELAQDSEVRLLVRPAPWSREGKLFPEAPFRTVFRTHGPLKVSKQACGYGSRGCRPGLPFSITLTNPLAPSSEQPGVVDKIRPELDGVDVRLESETITILGDTQPDTTYTVRLHRKLLDVHGQTLGRKPELSFRVGAAEPFLQGPAAGSVVRRLSAQPSFPVRSAGVESFEFDLHRVTPSDWPAWARGAREGWEKAPLPGVPVESKTLSIEAPSSQVADASIPLEPALSKDAAGLVAIEIRPRGLPRGQPRRRRFWTVVSDVLLDAWAGPDTLFVAATGPDGQPRADLEVRLEPGGPHLKTGPDGLAKLPLPSEPLGPHPWIETDGGGFLPEGMWSNQGFSKGPLREPELPILSVDDRGLYRPGETAYIKGWARRFDVEEGLEALPEGASLSYEVKGPRGQPWTEGTHELGALGSFDLAVEVPRNANLGFAQVNLRVKSEGIEGRHVHRLRIEEFRRPRFEVDLEAETEPHLVGRSLSVIAEARTYTGGPLGDREVRWSVSETQANYRPPRWDGWRFGRSLPWWWSPFEDSGWGPKEAPIRQARGRTGADGRSRLTLDPTASAEPFPTRLTVRAEVQDVDRRAVTEQKALLIHPADRYVGIRFDGAFLDKGQDLRGEAVVVDVKGDTLAGAALTLSLHPSPGFGSVLTDPKPPVETLQLASAREEPIEWRLDAQKAGRYLLRAEAIDERGRVNRTETPVYWAGQAPPRSADTPREALELASDRERYAVAEVATLTVRSPWPSARGFWFAISDGPQRVEALTLDEGTGEIRLPITERMRPDVGVEVWVFGGNERDPRWATGRLSLKVDAPEDRLTVRVEPAASALEPGAETAIRLEVRNAQGEPVPDAEVALAVVDEAVLSVAEAAWPDPLEALVPSRGTSVRSWHARRDLVLDADKRGTSASFGGFSPESSEADGPIRRMALAAAQPESMNPSGAVPTMEVRAQFRPIAHFEPGVRTDRHGRARVSFTLPDDLTRYRARAVAATKGKSFGRGEATFVVQKSVSVESRLPRFFSHGDRPELSFIVENRTRQAADVVLAVDAQGVRLAGPRGWSARVPPDDRVELRFAGEVEGVRQATLRAVLEAGAYTDATRNAVDIYPPATLDAFAEHGSLESGVAVRQIEMPDNALDAVGGLSVEVSPTRLLSLKDALAQVGDARYLSIEERASRLLTVAALGSMRGLFTESSGLPPLERLESRAEGDLERLLGAQREDGGWGFWAGATRSDPFLSGHVLHALLRARAGERTVPDPALERAARYLEGVVKDPPELERELAVAIQAHALWTLAEMGRGKASGVDLALELAGGPGKAPTEALAWLYGASLRIEGAERFRGPLERALAQRLDVTARTAHLVSAYPARGQVVLHGPRRADAVYLLDRISARPEDPMIHRLLAGLLAGRGPAGLWAHTQESAWALLAVARYATTYEKTPPRFSARAWLGDRPALDAQIEDRESSAYAVRVPMKWMLSHPEARSLLLSKEGPGRMYYRLGLEFAPADLRVEPASRGLHVRRTYAGFDDPSDVEATQEGWRVRAGARVRVRLEVVARGPRHHVALIDRLPAGFEPLHPLADPLQGRGFWPEGGPTSGARILFRAGWDHENLRDTGAEAFVVSMAPGLHRYEYVARAISPGRYRAAPARASEMYAPETFARTGVDLVEVQSPDSTDASKRREVQDR